MGNEQSKEPSLEHRSNDQSVTESNGPGITGTEEPPICKIEPNYDPMVNKIQTRKRKWVDDDVICISDDDDVTLVEDLVEDCKIQPEVQAVVGPEVEPKVRPEVEPKVGPEVRPEVEPEVSANTKKDDSNTDSDASPIKHHRTDSRVESMEVDEVKKSLFPIDPKYECVVSIYNCNADDIQELQVSFRRTLPLTLIREFLGPSPSAFSGKIQNHRW